MFLGEMLEAGSIVISSRRISVRTRPAPATAILFLSLERRCRSIARHALPVAQNPTDRPPHLDAPTYKSLCALPPLSSPDASLNSPWTLHPVPHTSGQYSSRSSSSPSRGAHRSSNSSPPHSARPVQAHAYPQQHSPSQSGNIAQSYSYQQYPPSQAAHYPPQPVQDPAHAYPQYQAQGYSHQPAHPGSVSPTTHAAQHPPYYPQRAGAHSEAPHSAYQGSVASPSALRTLPFSGSRSAAGPGGQGQGGWVHGQRAGSPSAGSAQHMVHPSYGAQTQVPAYPSPRSGAPSQHHPSLSHATQYFPTPAQTVHSYQSAAASSSSAPTAIAAAPAPASQMSPPERAECELCRQTFSRKHDLKRHMQSAHTQTSHLCRHCDKGFSRADSLKRHQDNGCGDDA
ncbi:hypothetical protein A0H81_09351 [Grifola frondosa]|uniref:C2H2-type domain-containing protein n=1 Tax=Grifola frondosa TaxID=5627 RepID=A0A1C7M1R0_GRIFR|nr:hypothetical protein A0H81_09351 [Grifola frondosa]